MSSLPSVFVIGATGFIGKPLTTLLTMHGFPVLGLARNTIKAQSLAQEGIEPVIGALDKPEEWIKRAAEAEVLIDCSQNNEDRAGHARMVEAAANLWAAERKKEGKSKGYFIYTSGTGVYGDLWHKVKRPLTEADTPTPPEFVAFRPALEQRVINSSEWFGYVIRPGLVYGRQGSITARLIASLPSGSTATITLPVPPDLISATVHVDDLAFVYLAILERRDDPNVRGQIYNAVNPVGEKRKDMLEAVSKMTGFRGTIAYRAPQTPHEIFGAYSSEFDTTKVRTVLEWRPRQPGFVQGIERWGRAYRAFL